MSFGPSFDSNAVTVDFAYISIRLPERDWYVGLNTGGLFDDMHKIIDSISELKDHFIFPQYGRQAIADSPYADTYSLDQLQLHLREIEFEAGSISVELALAATALVFSSVSAAGNYEKAKDNLPKIRDDLNRLADLVRDLIARKFPAGTLVDSKVHIRKGFSDLGRRIAEKYDVRRRK